MKPAQIRPLSEELICDHCIAEGVRTLQAKAIIAGLIDQFRMKVGLAHGVLKTPIKLKSLKSEQLELIAEFSEPARVKRLICEIHDLAFAAIDVLMDREKEYGRNQVRARYNPLRLMSQSLIDAGVPRDQRVEKLQALIKEAHRQPRSV